MKEIDTFQRFIYSWFGLSAVVFLILAIGSSGCIFSTLKKELDELDRTVGMVGHINPSAPEQENVVVILYKKSQDGAVIYKASVVDSTTHNYAIMAEKGDYLLFAFADENSNLILDQNEPFGYFGKPDVIEISEEAIGAERSISLEDLDFSISTSAPFPTGFPAPVVIPPGILTTAFSKIADVVCFDDEVLSERYGTKGYWQPMTFLKEVGIRISFLEPYDPDKVPVLFIHGALGTPLGWKEMVETLDHERFQPWFFYYPSGLALDRNSKALNMMIMDLHKQLGFKKLYVVAQSMGGLVARSFILMNVFESQQDFIKLFVSISTPWNGHPMAAEGVKRAPESVPSWHDMVPESAFIRSLFQKELPPFVRYYLMFSYKGNCSLFLENNDGTVELSSELDQRAQKEADRLFGYNEDHGSILFSERVQAQINDLLKQ
jgi:pimeloyl-ACP methyl ester carboxylesterase